MGHQSLCEPSPQLLPVASQVSRPINEASNALRETISHSHGSAGQDSGEVSRPILPRTGTPPNTEPSPTSPSPLTSMASSSNPSKQPTSRERYRRGERV